MGKGNGNGNGNGSNTADRQRADVEAVARFLDDDGWHPQMLEDQDVFRMTYGGANGHMICYAKVRTDAHQLVFYAMCPVRAPEEARLAAAEYITRANYGLIIGNLELDLGDGEIRYKSAIDFESERLNAQWIRNAIYPAVQTMDRYLPGLLKVIYGQRSPAEAIAEVEKDVH